MFALMNRTVFFLAVFLFASVGNAMIRGDKGNKPLPDPGWPKGAEKVFNVGNRIAWWEGPPLGGGQWHSECQGNADAFNQTLQDFQKIDAAKKRLVILDGVGRSFWLDPNRENRGAPSVEMDWEFTIWQPESWERQKRLPTALSAFRNGDSDEAPVPELRFYAGGAIDWKDVVVPKGIEVVDKRMQKRGFTLQDGRVQEGAVTEFGSGKPVMSLLVLESISPKATGGYEHQVVAETRTDENGRWIFKKIGDQWCRVVAKASGYAPRIVTHISQDSGPGWDESHAQLSKVGFVSGVVKDELERPLADVAVSLRDVVLPMQGVYESPEALESKTDSEGRFSIEAASGASGRLRVFREGYCFTGKPESILIPKDGIEIRMAKSASLVIEVKFEKGRTDGDYRIQVASGEEDQSGTWGASSSLGPDNIVRYQDVPPGVYWVHGQPNPGSEQERSEKVKVELVGGQESKVVVPAKQ